MIRVSAPGRADLFNTHQDYKGLPVVPAALKIRTYIEGKKLDKNTIHVFSENIQKEGGEAPEDEFSIDNINLTGRWSDYVKAVVKILYDDGHPIKGADLKINSEVPVASGLASSAALLVAVAGWFNYAYNLKLSVKDIAEVAYRAEHDVMRIPCGRLDQYGSAFGWIIKLETRPPFNVEQLPRHDLIFVVINSGVKHSTKAIHPVRQQEINEGLKKLLSMEIPESLKNKLAPTFDKVLWEQITEEEISPYLESIPKNSANRILFTIRMNESTEVALKLLRYDLVSLNDIKKFISEEEFNKLKEFKGKKLELRIIGKIMNYQHELLRDLYDVSLPVLEEIRNAMLDAGALGAKISGAGLGGALIALVEDIETGKKVVKSCIEAGAKEGWILPLDEGVKKD